MDYQVRDARPRDYGYVNEAFKKVCKLHCRLQPRLYRPVDVIIPKHLFMLGTLLTPLLRGFDKEKYSIKVAEFEGEKVGAVILEAMPDRTVKIENITAAREHISKGAVEALLDASIDWMAATDHFGLTAKISAKNDLSLNFAKKSGFVVESYNMGRCLRGTRNLLQFAKDPEHLGNISVVSEERSSVSWSAFPEEAVLTVTPNSKVLDMKQLTEATSWAKRTGHRHIRVTVPADSAKRISRFEQAGFETESYNVERLG